MTKTMTFQRGQLYKGNELITALGMRKFQDLKASGKLELIKDNTEGSNLYRLICDI